MSESAGDPGEHCGQRGEVRTAGSAAEQSETARENLDNPDYVEYIARGRYLVTKEGEQVFKFPSLQEDGE